MNPQAENVQQRFLLHTRWQGVCRFAVLQRKGLQNVSLAERENMLEYKGYFKAEIPVRHEVLPLLIRRCFSD